MIEPRAIALALGLANAGLLAVLARAPAPWNRRSVLPMVLLGLATGYAVGWGTTRLLQQKHTVVADQAGSAAPLV